jgi:hypothetical protein
MAVCRPAVRVLVCGSRTWEDYESIFLALRKVELVCNIEAVIEGEARGADILSRIAAEHLHVPVMPFPANWDKYGRSAGPIRNTQMLREGKPKLVLAFTTDLESSRGTRNMVYQAREAIVPVWVSTEGLPALDKLLQSLISTFGWRDVPWSKVEEQH